MVFPISKKNVHDLNAKFMLDKIHLVAQNNTSTKENANTKRIKRKGPKLLCGSALCSYSAFGPAH
jgi:hypothetical protein